MNKWKIGFFIVLFLMISFITISSYTILSLFFELQLSEKHHKRYEDGIISLSFLFIQGKSKNEIRNVLIKNNTY